MSFAYAQYKSTQHETASPVQIVVALYDGAIKFMTQAQHAIENKDFAKKGEAIRRAHAIVSELQATLDADHAPELCEELTRLYDFVLDRVSHANVDNAAASLDPAIEVMKTLRSAWHELATRPGTE